MLLKATLGATHDLEWWFGDSLPLNPYIKGRLVSYILKRSRPKKIVLPPCPEVVFEGEASILEYTLYHNWMKEWLQWLRWYWCIQLNPQAPLKDYFDAPICSTSWRSNQTFDKEMFRYGLLLRCYDLAHQDSRKDIRALVSECPPREEKPFIVHIDEAGNYQITR